MECKIRISQDSPQSGTVLTNLSEDVTLYFTYTSSPGDSSTQSIAPTRYWIGPFDNKNGIVYFLKEDNKDVCVGSYADAWSKSVILFISKDGIVNFSELNLTAPYSYDIVLTTKPPKGSDARLTSNRLSPPKFKLRKFFRVNPRKAMIGG